MVPVHPDQDVGAKLIIYRGEAAWRKSIHPSGLEQIWLDTNAQLNQAHGGGILFDQGVYYWFGEDKEADVANLDPSKGFLHRVEVIGIHCYSSTDLYNWKDEGLVLPAVQDDPMHDLHPSKVVERPKVNSNPKDTENMSCGCISIRRIMPTLGLA